MKKLFFIFSFLIVSNFCFGQIGVSDFIKLQDGNFIGSLWEPRGVVTYDSKQYGLTFYLRTSDTYLDILTGHKISIEFKDGSREIYDILTSNKEYSNTIVNHKVIDIYNRMFFIYPNFEKLCSIEILKFVIQRTNGKIWVIEVKQKRAKKLLNEFKEAMNNAEKSYNIKVNNNNYFN